MAEPGDRHWRATDERYPAFDHGDPDCGCRRCVSSEAFRRGHAQGGADWEARVLADVADALAERIPTIRGLMQKVGNDAPLHAFVEALRSGSGSWRGETTDGE